MGTRGAVGFVINGEEKLAYNHWDSYPSGLGADVLAFLRSAPADIKDRAAALRVVGNEEKPTPEDVERLRPWVDTAVATGSLDDWYVLLRGTQGDIGAMLTAGIIEDAHNFPLDSLFCEWAYVVDLDADTFEVYEGFQRSPHAEGRFANRLAQPEHRSDQYYPVRLIASWPLSALPTDKEFLAIEESEDDS